MHVHSTSQASLAADIVDRITALDEMLKLADNDDQAELAQRMAALDPAEFQHILAIFGVQPVLGGKPVEVWVAADEDVKDNQ